MRLLQPVQQYDMRLFYRLNRENGSCWIKISQAVSRSGDGHWYLLLAMAFLAYQQWALLSLLLLAFAIERTSYLFLKNSLKRPRPAQTLVNYQSHIRPSDQFSFPSGHTSAAFLIASILAQFYPPITLIAYAWAMTVGLSRIILGVHFPSDIAAGALHGYLIFIGASLLIY